MKYLFAVNPVSGKGRAKKRMHELSQLLEAHHYDYMIYETKPIHYAYELRQIIEEHKITHAFAVGGDGTAHEVLNAVIGLNVYFGVIPFGSGNDFARILNLPQKIDKVFEMIEKNNSVVIDAGKVEDRYFLNYVSFGVDVAILHSSLYYKKFFHSGIAYILALISSLITYKCKNININDAAEKLYLAAFHNGKYYGGGMKINPYAEVNDGILNLCTVKKMNRFKLLFLFPSVFSGKHYRYKDLVSFASKRQFTVSIAGESVKTGVDGELYEFASPIHISVVPESIQFIQYQEF